MKILDFLGMYFDAVVVEVKTFSLLFRLALAILCCRLGIQLEAIGVRYLPKISGQVSLNWGRAKKILLWPGVIQRKFSFGVFKSLSGQDKIKNVNHCKRRITQFCFGCLSDLFTF